MKTDCSDAALHHKPYIIFLSCSKKNKTCVYNENADES